MTQSQFQNKGKMLGTAGALDFLKINSLTYSLTETKVMLKECYKG